MKLFARKKSTIAAAMFGPGRLGLNDQEIKRRGRAAWVEDVFIDYNEQVLNRSDQNYLGLILSKRRLHALLVFLLIGVMALGLRAAYLQIIKGAQYLQTAENNRIRVYHLPAPRGIIYDRNEQPLVKNVPSFTLYITPVDFPTEPGEQRELLNRLAGFFPENYQEIINEAEAIINIDQRRKEYYQPQAVRHHIDYDRAVQLRVAGVFLPGVNVEVANQRQYFGGSATAPPSLSHLLGYVGKISGSEYPELKNQGYLFNDQIGKTGLEKYYETILRGEYGRKQIEVDSLGKELKVLAQEPVVKGDNLILSLDSELQVKLEELLAQALTNLKLSKGAAVVQDPRNGQILAMVSLPAYDNNLFAQGIDLESYNRLINDADNPLFNRVISGEYPSGSTIKPLIAAAALQEKIITAATSFLSTGGIRIEQWFFPDWLPGGHGRTNVYRALAQSVNTFFYIIGGGYEGFSGLGIRKIADYGDKFGLGRLSGVDLPNEQTGFLPSPEWKERVKNEIWYIGDTYHAAIGQGDLLVTPLQINNYIAAIANYGTLYQPRLAKTIIRGADGQHQDLYPVVLNENFIDRGNLNIVRQGMRDAVTTGSARALNSLPAPAAGKTGTAQWGVDQPPHAWFTAFAPYDEPEVVITVLLEQGEEGSENAVPVVKDFLSWYFSSYQRN